MKSESIGNRHAIPDSFTVTSRFIHGYITIGKGKAAVKKNEIARESLVLDLYNRQYTFRYVTCDNR